jgi:phosphomannomutase
MRSLRINTYGCHGIVGDSLSPMFAIRYGNAVGSYFGTGPVVVAGDPRASTPMLRSALVSGLISCGTRVVDLGVCTMPVAQHHIRANPQFCGGIYISGSYSPAEWNGFTVFGQNGTVLPAYEGTELLDIFHSRQFVRCDWSHLGTLEKGTPQIDSFIGTLLKQIDADAIRKRRPLVVVDSCNGAAPGMISRLADELGFRLIPLNHVPDGNFPHDPEPRPRNSRQASSILTGLNADIGFCLNSNGTCAAIITENGETISEEFTFPLVADHILAKHPGSTIVTNLCTSRMIDDVAARHGAVLSKTMTVGQASISETMASEGAILGGEGNGYVAYAPVSLFYDVAVSIALILESLALRSCTSSQLVQQLPARYHLVKRLIPVAATKQYAVIDRLRQAFATEDHVSSAEGLRIEWVDGWLHIRASSSRPVLQLICECRVREKAEERADLILQQINRIL